MSPLALADQTARSFALTLRLLPVALRDELCLAYLMARVSDSIADAGGCAHGRRMELLAGMNSALAVADTVRFPIKEIQAMAGQLPRMGERLLLSSFGQLCGLFFAQRGDAVERGVGVLTTILAGQMEDVAREAAGVAVLADEAALDDYTWKVAGCVGVYWTEVLAARVPGSLVVPPEVLRGLGRRYGQALQLLNILRDAPADWRQGRCYLPGRWGSGAELPPGDSALPELYEVMRGQLARCRDGLEDGLRYREGLGGWRVRSATVLPAALGLSTVDALERADCARWLAGVKISRAVVRRVMISEVARALLP